MSLNETLVPALQSGIAAELRRLRGGLEQMAETLVGDEHFITHFLDQLQAFDFLVQCADESAAVLDRLAGGVDPIDAVASVRLGAVQQRLQAAMTPAQAA